MRSRSSPALPAALARIARRREVRALARIAARLEAPVWLVGGVVRDAVLGREIPEIDVAIGGSAEAAARALESEGVGRAVFLSKDRPGPRVFRVAGRKPLDIAEIEGGSIVADLGRRDFTVNALAVALAPGRAEVLDPFGGLADLARRRLHPVAASNLTDDPLRALRAARFLATHGLVPDGATLDAARRAAPLLKDVAVERRTGELLRILEGPAASPALVWSARAGILPAALGVPIPHRRAAAAARALSACDDAASRRRPDENRRRMRLALLALHLGLSEADARAWLARLRVPRRDAADAAGLVGLARSAPGTADTRDAWRWILRAGTLVGDALHILARWPPGRRAPARIARLARLSRRKRRPVRVDGADVMRWLDIPAGPDVGAWLGELAIAAASGRVQNRREARNWLSVQVRNAPSPAIIRPH